MSEADDQQSSNPPSGTSWLEWGQKLQAIAQSGLTFATDPFDIERYESIREIASGIIATGSRISLETIQDLYEQQSGYATPKVGVRGAVFRDDKILMVKERLDEGRWTLPGGFIDVNESPSEAVVREIAEESGYKTRVIKLLHLYDPQKHSHPPKLFHIFHIHFQCEITGGQPNNRIETDAVEFFEENHLPELSTGRITSDQISRLFGHYRNPNQPTSFD
jgi:ADP-ribose pyrophosphatase YjhB (NUDIX family)